MSHQCARCPHRAPVYLSLFEAFRSRTVFFITHRLSTVRPADMIVLMDQGAVRKWAPTKPSWVQGWYYALYQSQMKRDWANGANQIHSQ